MTDLLMPKCVNVRIKMYDMYNIEINFYINF